MASRLFAAAKASSSLDYVDKASLIEASYYLKLTNPFHHAYGHFMDITKFTEVEQEPFDQFGRKLSKFTAPRSCMTSSVT